MNVIERSIELPSKYLSQIITVGCIIPKQIDKLLILLHGYDGTFSAMKNNLLLEAYSTEHNLLIAIPNVDNGYYIDRENYSVSGFVAEELIQYLCEEFSLKKDIEIILGGCSMGGYGALLIGAKYPSVFHKVVCISAAFIQGDVAIGNPEVVGIHLNSEVMDYFEKTFGPFETLEDSVRRNPLAAISTIKDEDKKLQVIVTCGTEDMLYIRNHRALRCIKEKGIECEFYPIEGGRHDYDCFKKGLDCVVNKL